MLFFFQNSIPLGVGFLLQRKQPIVGLSQRFSLLVVVLGDIWMSCSRTPTTTLESLMAFARASNWITLVDLRVISFDISCS